MIYSRCCERLGYADFICMATRLVECWRMSTRNEWLNGETRKPCKILPVRIGRNKCVCLWLYLPRPPVYPVSKVSGTDCMPSWLGTILGRTLISFFRITHQYRTSSSWPECLVRAVAKSRRNHPWYVTKAVADYDLAPPRTSLSVNDDVHNSKSQRLPAPLLLSGEYDFCTEKC